MKYFKRLLLILLCLYFTLSTCAFANGGVVLALSGGGMRGLAHIGALQVIEEHAIPIVGIVATSMGSIVGGLYAGGYTTQEIINVVNGIDLATILSERSGRLFVPTGVGSISGSTNVSWLRWTKTGEQTGPLGFFTATKLLEKFTKLVEDIDVVNFYDLPIPFAAIATDLDSGEKVVLSSGSLASAMRASMAIPGVFEPWKIGNRLLVDGGLVSNLPVMTAKELFPGYPVIAIDVSDIPGNGNQIKSMIDVLDRSLTILTHQNVQKEQQYADIVISPNVYQFQVLDQKQSESVIKEGKRAALASIEKILALSQAAPPPPVRVDDKSDLVVTNVEVTGLSPQASAVIRKEYLHWVGKPVNPDAISNASRMIADRDDILSANYHVERDSSNNGIIVFIDVVSHPNLEFGVNGYTTNIDKYRGLHLKGTARNLFAERDMLSVLGRIGDDWGIDATYRTPPSPLNYWEIRLAAQHWSLDSNMGERKWRRESIGFSRQFQFGDIDVGLGYALENIDGYGGNETDSGPILTVSLNTLDVPSDPTKGDALTLSVWWSDFNELLYRLNYFRAVSISDKWRAYIKLGYMEGDLDTAGHAAYLGAAEELYSAASHPIEAERMAWINVAFRRVIQKSIIGTIAAEIFASVGHAMDRDYEKIETPWEAGLALSFPNNLVDIRIAAFYSGEDKLKFAFFVGNPVWEHYPLP